MLGGTPRAWRIGSSRGDTADQRRRLLDIGVALHGGPCQSYPMLSIEIIEQVEQPTEEGQPISPTKPKA
jgi:hypothetical protein